MDAFRELDEIPDDESTASFVHSELDGIVASVGRLTLAVNEDAVPVTTLVQRKAATFTEQLAAHQVVDDATYLACDGLFSQAVAMLDEIAATFDPIIAAAYKAHKEACAQKAKFTKPVTDALDGLKQRFLDEKKNRDAAAERLRLEVETQLRADAVENKLAEAVALELAGRQEEAELVFDEPPPLISVPIEAVRHRVAPALSKTSTPGQYKCTSVNLKKLAKAVADGVAPESYITAAMPELNARARADKTAFNVPGCTAEFVPTVRVRR
jgi:hypothetical protein